MSETVTRGVRIRVVPRYLDERSNPLASRFLFSYTVTISNEGEESVQLLSRRWGVPDGDGDVEVVEGPGVVGETPLIPPGEAFEYTSFCPLGTPFGKMEGHYNMVTPDGGSFQALIAPFGLAAPATLN